MTAAVIVAAGRGTRMGPGMDKLFIDVLGRPVVAHAWARMDASDDIDTLVLVVRPGMEHEFHRLAEQHVRPVKPWRLAPGGAERQDSVWNGLNALQPEVEWVAIQDGARPCTRPEVVAETLAAARSMGAAVAACRVTDTIKESDGHGRVARHLERSRLWAVQTPQCFRVDVIRRALAEVQRRGLAVTDDTAACEVIGQDVALVEDRWPNPKVTVPADVPYVELLLSRQGTGAGPGERP
ncbi:MAG: 2-C-methyl-D-erythritol 4-phosphate cytidylyltransferase [Verrucomicrobiota bacterium]|jgi:2-C-methyl-D-erythritol 4-phosphate cytidylyltransferase